MELSGNYNTASQQKGSLPKQVGYFVVLLWKTVVVLVVRGSVRSVWRPLWDE